MPQLAPQVTDDCDEYPWELQLKELEALTFLQTSEYVPDQEPLRTDLLQECNGAEAWLSV